MRRAIVLAREAEAAGGEPYGALIADASGAIVAEGRNHASNNPLWHGETSAIANLSRLINTSVYDVAGNLTLYTTAEPCPMCMGAILWSGAADEIWRRDPSVLAVAPFLLAGRLWEDTGIGGWTFADCPPGATADPCDGALTPRPVLDAWRSL